MKKSTPQQFADIFAQKDGEEGNLMLHAGGEELSLDELKKLPTPPATNSFTPISHYDFVALIQDTSDKVLTPQGYHLDNVKVATVKDHMRLFGTMTFQKDRGDMKLAIGFRQALDKSMAAGIALGGNVTICDNMMIVGQEVVVRKHTGDIHGKLRDKIVLTLFDVDSVWNGIQEDHQKMVNVRMSDDAAFSHYGRAFGHGLLGPRHFTDCIDEWKKPKFDHGENTLWKWYNCGTQVFKNLPMHKTMKKHRELHHFSKEIATDQFTITESVV